MNPKYKLGLIAGTFDIIHPGYIRMFKDAKSVCQYLVVAIHTDPNLENGKPVPIFSWKERMEVVGAIKYVDRVTFYESEADLVEVMKNFRPNVLILGSDHRGGYITGEELGIPIYFHERDHNWSETKLKQMVVDATGRKQ